MAYLLVKKTILCHFLKLRYMQNKKVSETFSLCWDIVLPHRSFMLDMEKSSEKVNKDFFIEIFVELFVVHLLRKKRDFIAFLKWGYIRNKECCKTFATPGIS